MGKSQARVRRRARNAKQTAKASGRIATIEASLEAARQRHNAGDVAGALQDYQALLRQSPEHAEALHLTAVAYQQLGRSLEAVPWIERALRAGADHFLAYYNAACIYEDQGKWPDAERCARRAIERNPGYSKSHAKLGEVLQGAGRFEQAVSSFEKAIALDPKSLGSRTSLGYVWQCLNQGEKAAALYLEVLKENPWHRQARLNLGALLRDDGNLTDSIRLNRETLEREPTFAKVHTNLGNALLAARCYEEARHVYRRSTELAPEELGTWSNYLLSLNYDDALEPDYVFAEHVKTQSRMPPAVEMALRKEPSEKIRVGYVSADFRRHSVAYFIESILQHHDRSRFEVYCYADVKSEDAVTARLRSWVGSGWRSTVGLSHSAFAEQVRRDGIDVLVDLAGHAGANRLPVFAQRAAPVQVTYLGYPNTTGLREMDYRLTDPWADPPGQTERWHTETLVRLDDGFLVYQPPTDAPRPEPGPSARNEELVFGSFNNISKVSASTIALWSRLLHEIPEAKLLLKAGVLRDAGVVESLKAAFAGEGIDANRLIFVKYVRDPREHLAVYNLVDVALDPFPYHGTTTTFEALWMGKPVVTLAGETHASRVGVSILSRLGQSEWVASTPSEYVEAARVLALDLKGRVAWAQAARARMHEMGLVDGPRFARALEVAWEALQSAPRPRQATDTASKSTRAPVPDSITIQIEDDLEVVVPASTDLITPYVLREQEDWFEDEIRFVRAWMRPGMHVVDVGANYGLYTLSMSKRIGASGRLWAYEPAPSTAAYLKRSLQVNDFGQVTVVEKGLSDRAGTATFHVSDNSELNSLQPVAGARSTTIELTTLDAAARAHQWSRLDFLKLDAEGEEVRILQGATAVLEDLRPLVMYELKHGSTSNFELVDAFEQRGYRSYRLLPEPQLLVPFDPEGLIDGFWLNLFACHESTAQALEEKGWLVRALPDALGEPAPDSRWPSHFATMPYAQALMPTWIALAAQGGAPGWSDYERALNLWVEAWSPSVPVPRRAQSLFLAYEILDALVTTQATLPRLLTLARIALMVGFRHRAVDVLEMTAGLFGMDAPIDLNEPFAVPHPRFEQVDPKDRLGQWCLSAVLEQRERVGAFSSYFVGPKALPTLDMIASLGFGSPEMERRRRLIGHRWGVPRRALSAALREKNPANRNPQLWVG